MNEKDERREGLDYIDSFEGQILKSVEEIFLETNSLSDECASVHMDHAIYGFSKTNPTNYFSTL